jgi:elongation factor G
MHQTLLWGQGEMHLRVAMDRLKGKYNVPVEGSAPRTPYRETIRKGTQAHGRHKKQSGGHGQFGDVKIEIRPLQRGEGFRFENRVVGGTVPRQYIPPSRAGRRTTCARARWASPWSTWPWRSTTASSTPSTATSSASGWRPRRR